MKKIIIGFDHLRIRDMLYSYSLKYSATSIAQFKDMKCDMICLSYIRGFYQKVFNFDEI